MSDISIDMPSNSTVPCLHSVVSQLKNWTMDKLTRCPYLNCHRDASYLYAIKFRPERFQFVHGVLPFLDETFVRTGLIKIDNANLPVRCVNEHAPRTEIVVTYAQRMQYHKFVQGGDTVGH